jgi:hypothetical protein
VDAANQVNEKTARCERLRVLASSAPTMTR